jgi:DNA mismatch endonuclease (patch repair protein)
MMSKILGRDTAPEIAIRRLLFARGLRYRLHAKDLPGKPDLVFPKFGAVVFINGCFWHSHEKPCPLSKAPSSNIEFWSNKLLANRERDARTRLKLIDLGWRVGTVWECAIRRRPQFELNALTDDLHRWLRSERRFFETVPKTK